MAGLSVLPVLSSLLAARRPRRRFPCRPPARWCCNAGPTASRPLVRDLWQSPRPARRRKVPQQPTLAPHLPRLVCSRRPHTDCAHLCAALCARRPRPAAPGRAAARRRSPLSASARLRSCARQRPPRRWAAGSRPSSRCRHCRPQPLPQRSDTASELIEHATGAGATSERQLALWVPTASPPRRSARRPVPDARNPAPERARDGEPELRASVCAPLR